MKNKIETSIMVALLMVATLIVNAQEWETDGNEILGTEWFGADDNSLVPVRFRHEADDAVSRFEWYTTNGAPPEERMRLTRAGWLGLGTQTPFRKFHIHEADDPSVEIRISKTTNTFGMRVGVTNMGSTDPGWGIVGMSDDAPLLIHAHGQEAARFTREQYNAVDPDNDGQVNRLLLRYNSLSGVNLNTPYSMLTMGRNWPGAETDGLKRDWMNVGTTYLFNADILYHGLIEYEDAVTDAVTAWGCQEGGEHGPDNYRFLFITGTADTGDAAEEEGRETMRITPIGNVGIGDFSTMPNGLDEQPTQRLDVDGTARLRQMPTNAPNVIVTGVEQDEDPVNGDYVLNYLEFTGSNGDLLAGDGTWVDGSGTLCDWNIVGGGNNVAMGYPDACVIDQMLVGTDEQVGTNAKAFITKDYSGTTLRAEALNGDGGEIAGYFVAGNTPSTFARGVFGEAHTSRRNVGLEGWAHQADQINYGFRGTAESAQVNYGGYGKASEATTINYGLYGLAEGGTGEFQPTNNVGVYGRARDYASDTNYGGYFIACGAERNIGVYGETCDHGGNAGYFVGSVVHLQDPLTLSDEQVKTDFNEIEGALGLINELNPKEYYFNTAQYPHLNLKTQKSFGFSAQEVQQVLPEVVQEVHHPAKFDSLGEMISPSEDLLGIQYQEFIAILTAGIKEQQAQIQSQDDQIAGLQETVMQMQEQMQMMQQQIDGCCQGDITPKNSGMGQDNSPSEKSFGQNELYQNTPNPFRSQTTISYTLEQGGKVLLNIFDKTGKPITTLVEAEQPADTYRYEWDATGLPAGLYHYALYVDGELLVKKAIKLAD